MYFNRVHPVQVRRDPRRKNGLPAYLQSKGLAGLQIADASNTAASQFSAVDRDQEQQPARTERRIYPAPVLDRANDAKDLTPADRVLRALRGLRRRLDAAEIRAGGLGRLRRADIYSLLSRVYVVVRGWQHRDDRRDIARVLRQSSDGAIAVRSSLFLVLLRAALPTIDAKRLSKWAAALEVVDWNKVRKGDFVAFLENHGGIEGAARQRARIRAKRADWLERVPRHS